MLYSFFAHEKKLKAIADWEELCFQKFWEIFKSV